MRAYPPISRYLTLLALKSLNRSLKSELTNIVALNPPGVLDKLPGSLKANLGRKRGPEFTIERTIQTLEFSFTFYESFSHKEHYTSYPDYHPILL